MIANARMYSVAPPVAALWRSLFDGIARQSGIPVDYVEHPAPKPVADLWLRDDKAAVFMCGLPFSLATPAPVIVAAPVPEYGGPEYCGPEQGEPSYWTDLIVAADSPFQRLEDTFGRCIAFTTAESQSGFAAPLHHLMSFGSGKPLYDAVVAPAVTPNGAVLAVAEGRADIAPLDSYSHALLRRHVPDLAARIRTIARTKPTPIPPLVGSPAPSIAPLAAAFARAHMNEQLASIMKELLLLRFARPTPQAYEPLRQDFAASLRFWRDHPFARSVDPAFAVIQAEIFGLQESR